MKASLLKIFYPATVVEQPLPTNFEAHDRALFASDLRISIPQSGLYLLRRAWVTNLGIVYKDLRLYKANVVCYQSDFRNYRWRYFFKWLLTYRKLRFKGKKPLLVFDNYSGPNGFAHWICDGLTRLAELHDTLHDYTIVVPSYFKEQPLYTESLKLFNTGEVHYLEPGTATYFDRLFFPSPIGDTGNFHPSNVERLRQIVFTRLAAKSPFGPNIYISRAKASRRFVENEAEVEHVLAGYGFQTVYMEDHLFAEQVAIVRGARHIVSIHGAALSLLMFAETGSSVMEFRSEKDTVNNMYFLLAAACKLHYYYLNCKSTTRAAAANAFDLQVDTGALALSLKKMLHA